MLTDSIMYQALIDKNISYEGLFFAGVKTTGIFCRPICTARKPKRINVEFFKSTREAILHGYRPCKVCRPLELLHKTPVYISDILTEMDLNPALRFKDADLINRGIEPSKMRRWFLKNHALTFHSYQRMFRINCAFKKIKNGETVTSAAYDTGYESLSGFNDTFKSVFGIAPSKSKLHQIIDITRMETPLGAMFACANEKGICLLEFSDRKMLETELRTLARILNSTIVQGINPHFESLKTQLAEYFTGERKQFSLPLFSPGTPFQQQVWKALHDIPYGATVSYQEQARKLNAPLSVRAIAHANGMNRISILIPCHRVIGANGALTGYGGGIWRKKWLLDLEKGNQ